MSDAWHVSLHFKDAKSDKFWRARIEGNALEIHYGRSGTQGQQQTKRLTSPEDARAELDKQAAAKRKKGYLDTTEPTAPSPPDPQSAGTEKEAATVHFVFEVGPTRQLAVQLTCEGTAVNTVTSEQYADPATAQTAFESICQALEHEGYRRQ